MGSAKALLLAWIFVSKGSICSSQFPFFLTSNSMTWSKGKSFCEANHGRLVTIDTQDKYDRYQMIFKQANMSTVLNLRVFIGLSTNTTNCTNYIWSSGQPMGWSKWDLGNSEPNHCETRQCVSLRKRLFRTSNCYRPYTALCEHEASASTSSTQSIMATMSTEMTTLTTPTIAANTLMAQVTLSSSSTITAKSTNVTAPIPTSASTTLGTSCDCCTRRQTNVTQLSQTELVEVITQLKAELSVSKNNTSTHQRRLISVYESRPSSMVMGGVACTIMSVVVGWIVVPDFIMLWVFLFKCVRTKVITHRV